MALEFYTQEVILRASDNSSSQELPVTHYGVRTPEGEEYEVMLFVGKAFYSSNGGDWSPYPRSRYHRDVVRHYLSNIQLDKGAVNIINEPEKTQS